MCSQSSSKSNALLLKLLLCAGSLTLPTNLFSQSALIWIEGESASSSTARNHGWYNSVKKDQLSGGGWLHHFSNAGPARASWSFDVPNAGEYDLWVRANPVGAKLSWRLNEQGEWKEVDFSNALDQANLANDGGVDIRFVAWVKVGKVSVPAGTSKMEMEMHSKNQNHGGLDCFALIDGPFSPSGKLKLGEKTGLADPGTWAFELGTDPFSAEVLIDLSELNEDTAGANGFVSSNKQGDFVDGKGKPLRFWAVNTGFHYQTKDAEALQYHAKWLSRRGVNMVRSHSHLLSKDKDAKLNQANPEELDRIWRLVAAMKAEGIYTTISPYWAVATKWRPSLGLPNPGGSNLTGMLFWDETFQEGYKSWWRKLLTPENPHTGIPLAADPAVAILQLQNEDSLLFFTLQSVQGEARRDLRKRFYQFLIDKHNSLETAQSTWGGAAKHKNDDFVNHEAGLYSVWHLTQPAKAETQNRYADQLEFYGRLMYDFNASMSRFLREEIGAKQLINAGNWHTADAAKLYDIERWSYTANDVIGTNRYFNGGKHVNPNEKGKSGYAITKGDIFSGESVLRQPRRFPLAVKMPSGKPFLISESSWVPPLKYQSEGPFLVAAYSGLTGFDAFYWFSTGDADFGAPMGKWQMNTPMLAGQFPAAALLFRKGFVKRAAPVLTEHRSLKDLWQRRKPLAVEDAGYDPNRDQGTFNELSSVKASMDPLAYLAGPVEVVYDSSPSNSQMADVEIKDGIVLSKTGELEWDTDAGISKLNSPKAQGVTGFFKGKRIQLKDIAFQTGNEYLTAVAVSLDDLDLAESKKVFLQIGTTSRPHGWKSKSLPDGSNEILSLGGPPWNIELAKLTVTLENSKLKRAVVLNANFLKTGEIPIVDGTFSAPVDSMYVVLEE